MGVKLRVSGGFIVAAAAGAAMTLPAASAQAEVVDLAYDVYVGGSQVAEMRLTLDHSGDSYRVSSAVGLVGMASVFSDWRAQSESEGRIANGQVIPDSYQSYNYLSGEDRTVAMSFADGVVASVVAEPSADEDEREQVTAADWQEAIDPLTAIMVAGLSPVDCGGPQRLFDGRRVTTVVVDGVESGEAPHTDYGIYAGPATVCAYSVENVAGTSRRWDSEQRGAEETVVWFAPLAGDLAIPVRLEADTRFGALRGHLVAIGPVRTAN